MRIDFLARAVAWACLVGFAGLAHAELSPYSLGAGLSAGTDDNVFRAPAGQEVSDRYVVGSLSASADQTIGRQRLQASATLRRSQFQERKDLDNTGYGVQLGWNGATADEVAWNLSYAANRTLASYATIVEPERRIANIETSQQASAGLQIGLLAQWLATATLSHRSIAYSAVSYADDQYRLDSVGLGAQWNPLGPLSATVGPRFTRGHYPQARTAANGTAQPDEFVRRDLDLSMNWMASGASTLSARLSITRQQYELLSDRDYEGATGQVIWAWVATGKTRLNASISRDTGSETSFFTLSFLGQPLRGTGDNSQLTTSFTGRVDHDLTGKISLSLAAHYAQRRLAASTQLGDGALVLSSQGGRERVGSVSLAARYLPTRTTALGCEIAHHRRAADTTLSSAYRADTLSCSAQITLR